MQLTHDSRQHEEAHVDIYDSKSEFDTNQNGQTMATNQASRRIVIPKKQERNSQSTTFSQHEESDFNIQKLKSRFNARTQRTFQRTPHYALKRAKHTRHAEAAKNPETKTRRARRPDPILPWPRMLSAGSEWLFRYCHHRNRLPKQKT